MLGTQVLERKIERCVDQLGQCASRGGDRLPFRHGRRLGCYPGKHEPLVTKALFDKCQELMSPAVEAEDAHPQALPLSRRVPLRRVRLPHHHRNPKGSRLLAMHQAQGSLRPAICPSRTRPRPGQRRPFALARSRLKPPTGCSPKSRQEKQPIQPLTRNRSKSRVPELRASPPNWIASWPRTLTKPCRWTSTNVRKASWSRRRGFWRRKPPRVQKKHLSWFEPAKRFVLASKNAGFLLAEANQTKNRDFLRKAGSNLTVQNKLVGWEPRGAWKLVVNAGRLAQHDIAASNADAAMVGEPDQHRFKRRLEDSNDGCLLALQRYSSLREDCWRDFLAA